MPGFPFSTRDNAGATRPIPRLPHPSWSGEGEVAARRRITADDFWRRLGA